MDIEFIKENYKRISNEELIKIATRDANGLIPEALEIIKEEITKRHLDSNIIKGLEVQNKVLSIKEMNAYCEFIQKLACPKCGNTTQKLNGTLTSEVISYIVISQFIQKLKVGCPTCLDKYTNAALTKTLLLGWWGLPWGVVRTIKAIGHYMKAIKYHHLDYPNDYLKDFIIHNIGEIETYKNSDFELQKIINKT